MASKSENSEIAVLQTQMEAVKTGLSSVEAKVDKLLERFETTSTSFATKDELDKLEKKFTKKSIWDRITTATITTIIVSLLGYFFATIKH